jgi:spore maturation protein CgeB
MRVVFFCHSIISDWNHRDAAFLRGVVAELRARRHQVDIFEPAGGWSMVHMVRDHGVDPIKRLAAFHPDLDSTPFDLDRLDLDEVLDDAELVVVHEWNDRELIDRIGLHRCRGGRYQLMFFDSGNGALDLQGYDAILADRPELVYLYQRSGWSRAAFLWPYAADTRVFQPFADATREHDVLWYGRAEVDPCLLEPISALRLKAHAFGPRYTGSEIAVLAEARIKYCGWIPAFDLPRQLSRHKLTMHLPRRPSEPFARETATIELVDAMATGTPVIAAPWASRELATLVARDREDMKKKTRMLIEDRDLWLHISLKGLETVRAEHTCAHRADRLLAISARLSGQEGPRVGDGLDLHVQAP